MSVPELIRESALQAVATGVGLLLLIAPLGWTLWLKAKEEKKFLQNEIERNIEEIKSLNSELNFKIESAKDNEQRAMQAKRESEIAQQKAEQARVEARNEAADALEELSCLLDETCEHLSVQVEQVSSGASTQHQRTMETFASMGEMNVTVLEVARSALNAADRSESAQSEAKNGLDVVENVVASIGIVSEKAVAMSNSLHDLGESARGISSIISVINDIADQTNLLALNAAIEAARAGEAGRGFSVVADEVRKFAEKTVDATKEVEKSIKSIQELTASNIEQMQETGMVVTSTAELAHEAGVSLRGIVELVVDSSMQVNSIATASEEQSATSEQINLAVDEINSISSETSAGMERFKDVINELKNQSTGLTGLVRSLRS
jgi:methyl-accepting chemotaxis protein